MGDRLLVESADEAASLVVEFVDADHGYKVTLQTQGARAATQTDLRWKPTADFFGAMASDWSGWDGMRELAATKELTDYGDPAFRLSAANDGSGHTTLLAELADPHLDERSAEQIDGDARTFSNFSASGGWQLRAVLVLETWQLDDIAKAALALTKTTDKGMW